MKKKILLITTLLSLNVPLMTLSCVNEQKIDKKGETKKEIQKNGAPENIIVPSVELIEGMNYIRPTKRDPLKTIEKGETKKEIQKNGVPENIIVPSVELIEGMKLHKPTKRDPLKTIEKGKMNKPLNEDDPNKKIIARKEKEDNAIIDDVDNSVENKIMSLKNEIGYNYFNTNKYHFNYLLNDNNQLEVLHNEPLELKIYNKENEVVKNVKWYLQKYYPLDEVKK
ncbi:hypothetical protein [Metamycoplasma canadense]|uniref:hypothetical protein n=1 Tax=Metamycoplasma canadense TaxID=29554 RepID=UPI0005EE2E85|nr:hypothetical protein [Metamycoplasma canadense]